MSSLRSLLAGLALTSSVLAAAGPLSNFESPLNTQRPKFRYWFHDASLDDDILSNDIQQIASIGAGGIELVPFYNYGFGGPGADDWDIYGFGTPAYRDVLVTALQACKANDLIMDFALGASQAQGVPAEPLTPGLAVQLVYGSSNVKGGKAFEGKLPEAVIDWNEELYFMQPQEKFGESKLVGVSAGAVRSKKNDTLAQIVLEEDSLIDLSDLVVDGKLEWDAPSDHEEYVVFAFYERYTNQRSCKGGKDAADFVGNGSWVTDHWSAAGAKLATDFWEEYVLDDEVRQLLAQVGQHSWEDSMEIQAALFWSPDFLERFESARGYNPIKYLPLMFHQNNAAHHSAPPYEVTYVLPNDAVAQSRYNQDYRLTLNEGLVEYLSHFDKWSKTLGTTHSAQVAYGMPVNVMAAVSAVSGPELESLAFTTVDSMLQYAGPAHLANRNLISTEVGAVQTGAYTQSLPSLIKLFNEAFAGGVNMMVIHGATYGGEFPLTTWPGYTPFGYVYSEAWSNRQPAWEYMSDLMDYTARNQFVLQAGTAKKDIAFYLWSDPWGPVAQHDGAATRAAGFSYEYLTAENLATKEAAVSDGVLAASGPAYRALVLEKQSHISPEAAAKLVEFAEDGLPIVVIGGLPDTTIGSVGQDIVSSQMKKLESAKHSNVKFIDSAEGLLDALAELSVLSRVSATIAGSDAAADWYTVWRSDQDIDYVFFYNEGNSSSARLNFEVASDRVPVRLNAWTGQQELIADYTRSETGVSFDVSLEEGQTQLFAFISGDDKQTHVTSHTDNVQKVVRTAGKASELSVLLTDAKAATLKLSDDETKEIPASKKKPDTKLPSVELGPWNLTVASWEPSKDKSVTHSAKVLHALGPQSKLEPWSAISDIESVSGVGNYTTSFKLPKSCQLTNKETAVIINFGPVLHTMNVWINGERLPGVDIADPEVDVTEYIHFGEQNTIEIVVSSTLFNAVKERVNQVKMFGGGPYNPMLYTEPEWQEYGLVEPVRLSILRRVNVRG